MLAKHAASATVAVREIKRATRFYEETLGLRRVHEEGGEAITYQTGSSTLLVYRSQYAGTNQATAVTWTMGKELDAAVKALRDQGVKFERYEMPDTRHEGDVHVAGDTRVAWFKDPDGNIHALING